MIEPGDALLLVDLQNYYLDPASDFYRFSEYNSPGAMQYITSRCRSSVLPGAARLLAAFRATEKPVIFLRLCGRDPERLDLHRLFRESFLEGRSRGFAGVYPLANESAADVAPAIAPVPGEAVFDKTTFSGFHSGKLARYLTGRRSPGIRRLIVTGLATSQCVETTARDASDLGYEIVMIEDCLADYTQTAHLASLYASRAVCGGDIRTSDEYLEGI